MTMMIDRQRAMGILERYRHFRLSDVIEFDSQADVLKAERSARINKKLAIIWGRNHLLYEFLTQYKEKFQKRSAYIFGMTGSGKTAMLCAYANTELEIPRIFIKLTDQEKRAHLEQQDIAPELVEAHMKSDILRKDGGLHVLYTTEHDICGEIDYFQQARWKTSGIADPMERLIKCEVLILDEFGAYDGKRDRHRNAIEYMIDRRYRDNKAIFLGSNMPWDIEQFKEHYGVRVASRLLEMCGNRIFELQGDWRHER